MKKTTLILIIFAFCTTAKATNCYYSFFLKERINIALCTNNVPPPETTALYYRAMAMVLNEYIKEKIANGKLEDKRFEIQVTSSILHRNHLELTQNRNGYFVSMLMSAANLNNLRTIVHYFARPDWQPFIAEAHGDWEVNDRRIGHFFRQNAVNEPFDFVPVTVWERNGVSLELSPDGFRYVIDGEPLPFAINENLPVRIRDRFLFFQNDGIHVVENGETVRFLELDLDLYRRGGFPELTVDVHSKWVNIGWRRDNWIYSYSYEQNRFFRVRGD